MFQIKGHISANRLRSTTVWFRLRSPWSRADQGSNPSTSISLAKAFEYGYGDPDRIERPALVFGLYDVELPHSRIRYVSLF